jgi:hypothetical protein
MVARLDEHGRARLNRPRADGGWSALQVLHHVITAEEGTRRYISKKMLAGSDLPRADVTSRLRLLALQAAMASPFRFKAPAVTAVVPPEIDPEQLCTRWEGVRTDWRTLLEGFPEELLDRMVFRHVLVGLMGLVDTLAFLQSHLDHHGRQVARLLNVEWVPPSP